MSNPFIPSKDFRMRIAIPDINIEYITDEEIEQMRKWIGFLGIELDKPYKLYSGKAGLAIPFFSRLC